MTFDHIAELAIPSLSQVRQMTSMVRGYSVKHSESKVQAATRLIVAVSAEFGQEEAEVIIYKVLKAGSCEEGFNYLKERLVAHRKERGQPTNLLEATIINGLGSEFAPSKLKERKMSDIETTTAPEDMATPATKAGKTKKVKAGKTPVPVRVSKHAGKTLTATKAENPRKVDSWGWKSMNIIIANPGILYEDFIKQGGRPNDLQWDVDKGNVTVA